MKTRISLTLRIALLFLVGIIPLAFGRTAYADAGTFLSDNFNTCLMKPQWGSFINPLTDAGFEATGTTVKISVPSSTADHDIWIDGAGALHINPPRFMMTAVNSANFGIEAKMNSGVAARYQTQGIIIYQDANTLLRFEFYGNGTNTTLYAARFNRDNNNIERVTDLVRQNIGTTGLSPLYMRVQRSTTTTWMLSYSFNGTTWTPATTLSGTPIVFTMTVNQIGFYGGNTVVNPGDTAPAHTAVFDYFSNMDAPAGPDQQINCSVPQNQKVYLPLVKR